MSKKKLKWGLRSRIFLMMFALLIVVFVLMFMSFNFFMNSYINTSAAAQLEVFTKLHGENENTNWPDLSKQPVSRVGVRAEAFVIDNAYNILHTYNETEAQAGEIIARYLEDKNIEPIGITNERIHSEGKVYYLSTVIDEKHDNAYLVFFADITAINEFANTINTILIVVVMIAAVLSFAIAAIIAHSVTKPVKYISDFAIQMGRGNFSTNTYSFQDKELAALAEAMNKSADQLGRYDSEQKTFFQNVSHELRTPLMSIKLNAEGIQYGLMDKEKSSGIIISEVDRLSELVEDLLYISRIDGITQKIDMQENDIRETLSLCAENQKSMADKKKISFVYDFSEKPVLLTYNEKHMYRALYNLIANALQYANTKVNLSCKKEGGKAVITISDDGPGIPSDDLPHIFERFYKGENGKHGIGLSIVKSVAELHSGEIKAFCTDMTHFILEIPIK